MTTEAQNEGIQPDQNTESVQDRLKEIGGSFMETIEEDERFQSGVPNSQRVMDLDFIQMTGLTRPMPKHTSPPSEASLMEDIDSSVPVNFFESGVQDVDHALSPSPMEPYPAVSPSATLPSPVSSSSAEALRQIASDLEKTKDLFDESFVQTSHERPARASQAFSGDRDLPDLEDTLSQLLSEFQQPGNTAQPPADAPNAGSYPENTPIIPNSAERLVEAEHLLQALEQQPFESHADRDLPTAPLKIGTGSHRFEWQDPGPLKAEQETEQESERRLVYDYSASPSKHRAPRSHVFRQRKRIFRAVAVILVLAASSTGGYFAYRHYIGPTFMLPDELIALASAQMESGNYRDASHTYTRFVGRYPDNPRRPEAQFNAAFALRSVQAEGPAAQQLQKETLALFQSFIKDNPHDPHRARAETIAGIVQFELNNYEAAIDILRSPDRLAEDPGASLPILRTLAAAYRKMGDYEHAESTYLQAAVFPKNYRADIDYYEAGDMTQERANLTEDKAEKERLFNVALDYWFKATHVINIDPITREEIQKQIDRLKTEMRAQTMKAPEDPADSSATPASSPAGELLKDPAPETDPASQPSPKEQTPAVSANPASETSPAANAEENKSSSKEPSS
jgi:tetratricopeptide (TPR) repeat protein